MDPDCVSLREYLEPAAGMLDPFELQNMRVRWRRWVIFDCNWRPPRSSERRSSSCPPAPTAMPTWRLPTDRKSAVQGKSVSVSVDHGGRRIIKQNKQRQHKIVEVTTTHNN